jgi:elongation factor P
MVIGVGDLRKGVTIELDNEPYEVVEYSSHKMQQRAPVTKIKLRELRTGRSIERTFNGYDVKLTRASVERRSVQYIYQDRDLYYFMDTSSYDQFPLTQDQLGQSLRYLIEQMEVEVLFFRDAPIGIELPIFVELQVTETPPGVKGNTAQGATKPATLETGMTINVPFFVNKDDIVRVDTRSGDYMERVR